MPPVDRALIAGYDPKTLDESIRRYVKVAEKNLAQLEQIEPRLREVLKRVVDAPPGAVPLDEANSMTILWDRMVKASLNLTKATDELSRLRSFVGGGPDSRPDLTAAGEIELRAIVIHAVKALGITDLKQLESSQAG